MSANEMQIGGEHYRGEYQHWDWVLDNCMSYLEGCSTKYISRWKNKNGLEDLKKSRHYVQKATEASTKGYLNTNLTVRPFNSFADYANANTEKFIKSGDYDKHQRQLFYMLSRWNSTAHLMETMNYLDMYIFEAASMTLSDAAGPMLGQGAGRSTSRRVIDKPNPNCTTCHGKGSFIAKRNEVRKDCHCLAPWNPEDAMDSPFGYDGNG